MTPVAPTQWRSSAVIGRLRLRNTFTDVKSVRESLWDSGISEELKGFWGKKSVVGHENRGQDSAKMLFQASVSVGDVLKMAFQCIQPDAEHVFFLHLFYCLVVLWDEERMHHSRRCRKYSWPWNSTASFFKPVV